MDVRSLGLFRGALVAALLSSGCADDILPGALTSGTATGGDSTTSEPVTTDTPDGSSSGEAGQTGDSGSPDTTADGGSESDGDTTRGEDTEGTTAAGSSTGDDDDDVTTTGDDDDDTTTGGDDDDTTTGDDDADTSAGDDDDDVTDTTSDDDTAGSDTTGDDDTAGSDTTSDDDTGDTGDTGDSGGSSSSSGGDNCGDGFIERGEECDGDELDGASCESLGFVSGALACGDDCFYDTTDCDGYTGPCCVANGTPGCSDPACTAEVCAADAFCCDVQWDGLCSGAAAMNCEICTTPDVCGNGTLDGKEQCDGLDFGDQTCADFDFDGGTLGCSDECLIETDECVDFSGNCCVPNDTPGCEDPTCVEQVCETFPFCCTFPSWFDFCSSQAQMVCDACNEPGVCGNGIIDAVDEVCDIDDIETTCLDEGFDGGTIGCLPDCSDIDLTGCQMFGGDCCEPHGGTGCDDPECTEAVCAADPFCCSVSWDGLCSGAANTVCATCGPGFCPNGFVDGDEECDTDDLDGETCQSQGFLGGTLTCADFCEFDTTGCVNEGGDCCLANGTPGCGDEECNDIVCGLDPTCCSDTWDTVCAAEAEASCAVCNYDGDCCSANGTSGCGDLSCVDEVCSVLPGCCGEDGVWTAECAALAGDECVGCNVQPGGGDCCSENGTPGCETSRECQFQVCGFDPTCCTEDWDDACVGAAEVVLCQGLCGQATDCVEADLGFGDAPAFMGTTLGADDSFTGACGNAVGPDVVFEYTATRTGVHVFSTAGSTFDTVLYALGDCLGTNVACNDDTAGMTSELSVLMFDGDEAVIVVGGANGATGDFTLSVTTP